MIIVSQMTSKKVYDSDEVITEEEKITFYEYENKLLDLSEKYRGKRINTFELKMIINTDLCLEQLLNFYICKQWELKHLIILIDLKQANMKLINEYQEQYTNIIKYIEYFLTMCKVKDLTEELHDSFSILMTTEALMKGNVDTTDIKGFKNTNNSYNILIKSIRSMIKEYTGFLNNMFKEFKGFDKNSDRKKLYTNDF